MQIQTIPIDDSNSIGVIDLRVCVQAITDCSPELSGQDCDYTIYAVDYSEPDTPLVGQGMLSWALDSLLRGDMSGQPKLVTGRVTKNLLGVFGGGNRETLEVKLRLSERASNKMQWNADSFDMSGGPMDAMTPTGASEWNSFIQSNPQLGQSAHVSRVASPAMSQGPPVSMVRRDSFGPGAQQMISQEIQRIAPTPIDANSMPPVQGGSSRPSSRTSNRAPRKKPPTGRPRGRPRKHKPTEGNTSGYEDGTEGEDAPAKKRVKTTKVEKAATNPFGSGPESLRVAASTSGSIRNFRPVAANSGPAAGSHLQEVPRAPTPVPDRRFPGRTTKVRRESTLGESSFGERPAFSPPSQDDGRSPDSIGPTPNYSEDSPGDIGSSPPVARTTPYIRSSPPASSPMLPPMPSAKLDQDSSFLPDAADDIFGDEGLPPPQHNSGFFHQPAIRKPTEAKSVSGVPIQVFQMQDGPAGQDLVHICSYNSSNLNRPSSTHHPHTQSADQPSLPPLKQDPSKQKKKLRAPSPPGMAPTPPPTTDAVEKLPSPHNLPEAAVALAAPAGGSSAEPEVESENTSDDANVEGRPSSHPPPSTSTSRKPKPSLARSQSAGPLALPTIPASEPIGPSSMSQSTSVDQARSRADSAILRRTTSTGPLSLPIPASDPPAPISASARAAAVSLTEAPGPASEVGIIAPSSPPASKSNKNFVKKHAIKQRLEEAILNGEMPPYCSNCGAIETPTWRKIWTQDRDGVPEYVEYSEKPGRVTAIEVLQRDADEKPTQHRVIKKGLGSDDNKNDWQELLLCNPCGIWLTKCKCHRPRDRWDKDASRLGQERRKRGTGRSTSRSKKPRTKSDSMPHPTSDAVFHTDALGSIEPSSPKGLDGSASQFGGSQFINFQSHPFEKQDTQSIPGSSHSRASGTAKSPIDIELDEVMGTTKRLLFPSPRKEGVPKALGDVSVNIVQTSAEDAHDEKLMEGKENAGTAKSDGGAKDNDDLEALFRSPAVGRPSTPPPNAKSQGSGGIFKTPTRPTPSHRPITRSVSRSLRSVKSVLASPGHLALLQKTPSKTPGSARSVSGNSLLRRSPRNHQGTFDVFDTPISRSINQMLSEPNGFGLGDHELDLNSLPSLDGNHNALIDFGNLLSTDGIMPSSPPKGGSMSFDYEASWATWNMDSHN